MTSAKSNHRNGKVHTTDKVLRHAEVFADFWLGVAAAGARGVAEVFGTPPEQTVVDRTFGSRLEHTFDQAANGLRIAFTEAGKAADTAKKELSTIRSPPPKKASGSKKGSRNGRARTSTTKSK